MPPKAPIGAAYSTMCTIRKIILPIESIPATIPAPYSPIDVSAMPLRMARNRTWMISPSAKAPTKVSGMICSRNAATPLGVSCRLPSVSWVGGDVESHSGLDHIDDDEADRQGDQRHGDEVG